MSAASFTRWRSRRGALALWLLLFGLGAGAQNQVAVPALRSPVTDLTQTLTPEQRAALERRLLEFEQRKGSQIAVLLVPSTQPETIEQYSIRVADAWKIGRGGTVDDGVLLLVAKQDRAVRIEVGYGLEGALPDAIANRITDEIIVPRFRAGDFFGGISDGIGQIIGVIEGEPLPEPARQQARNIDGIGSVLPMLLMLVFVGAGILRQILGSFGGAAATSGIAGFLVWVLTKVMFVAIGAAVLAFIVALFTGGGGGGRGLSTRRGRRGGWVAGGLGGLGGLGGGGGFGGGGWGGGGGGFGGGGATGRW